MSKPDGGRAFPCDGSWANGYPEGGMSLRDYFAAHAIIGVMRGYDCETIVMLPGQTPQQAMAAAAYQIADTMLAKRAEDGAT